MKHNKSLEEFLSEAQAPRIAESGHRERLKQQLILAYRKEKPIMIRWMTAHQKAAWALGLFLAVITVTSSWAGYSALRTYIEEVKTVHEINVIDEQTGETSTVQVETTETISIELPDSTAVTSDTPEETIKTMHEINVIDEETGEATSTVQVETAETISIE